MIRSLAERCHSRLCFQDRHGRHPRISCHHAHSRLLSERARVTVYGSKVESFKSGSIFPTLFQTYPSSEGHIQSLLSQYITLGFSQPRYRSRLATRPFRLRKIARWSSSRKESRDIDWRPVYDTMRKPAFVFGGRDALRQIWLQGDDHRSGRQVLDLTNTSHTHPL